jgi:hypothetical protein
MNYIRIIFISITIQLLTSSVFVAQPESTTDFENQFFVLDLENDKYDFSEVEKYFFTTFPHDDPTQGDVIYDRMKWVNDDMITLSNHDGLYGYIKFRNDALGFDSFRFTSKPYYNLKDDVQKILFVFKGKFPSAKGVWPAWWLNGSRQSEWLYIENDNSVSDKSLDGYSGVGQFYNAPSPVNCTDWPAAGEVDIIETINGENIVHNTIHTCPQMCDSEWNADGVIVNCANATTTDPNSGCSGIPFKLNSVEGTFGCLWENNSIRFYYWEPESDVRSDSGPLSKYPKPENWSKSSLKNQVKFLETKAECDAESHQDWQCENCKGKNKCDFVNLKMIFNITVCGKWAGDEFDETENSLDNCREYILREGKDLIDDQFIKIEYVAVKKLL